MSKMATVNIMQGKVSQIMWPLMIGPQTESLFAQMDTRENEDDDVTVYFATCAEAIDLLRAIELINDSQHTVNAMIAALQYLRDKEQYYVFIGVRENDDQ